MQVHTNIDQLPQFRNAVVTIGTFDGVHNGHKQILQQLNNVAGIINGETIIITFHPHPRRVIGNVDTEITLLNTLAEKIELLEKEGIDHLVIVPFTTEFANQPPESYIKEFLVKHFQPHTIIIGYDHRFGKNRGGDYHLLETMRKEYGYQLVEISEKILNQITISSTRIRQALKQCQIDTANAFLGYPYFFEATVVEGNKLGRTIGYPTANLLVDDTEKLIPGNGVYVVRARIPQFDPHCWFDGMMNIGVRPTVDGTRKTIEVNLFDFDADIYHLQMRVEVLHYLRGEQKFAGIDALKTQLALDKQNAVAHLANFK